MKLYYKLLEEQYSEQRNPWEVVELSLEIYEGVKKNFAKTCPSKMSLNSAKRKQASLCMIEANLRGLEASLKGIMGYNCADHFPERMEGDLQAVKDETKCNKLKLEILQDIKGRFEKAKIQIRKLRGY